jgi:hypothetical protein
MAEEILIQGKNFDFMKVFDVQLAARNSLYEER